MNLIESRALTLWKDTFIEQHYPQFLNKYQLYFDDEFWNHIFTRKKGTEVRFIWETNDVHVSALRCKGEKRRTENMLREISWSKPHDAKSSSNYYLYR